LKSRAIIGEYYNGGGLMPFKIDIQTNINEHELTIETCSQVIEMLQESYKNMRKEMYNHFLDMKHLNKALIVTCILAMLYLITDMVFFVYAMPVFILIAFVLSIISAEYLTTLIRKQIRNQISQLKKRKEYLIQKSKMNF